MSVEKNMRALWNSPFARKVMIVASGTASAQAITLLLTPVVTRLYGPESYGVLGVFLAIMQILTPAAALAYPIAIVLPRERDEALDIIRLSALLSVAGSLMLAAIIALWGDSLAARAGLAAIGNWIWLMPIYMVFAGFVQIMQQWLIRQQRFGVTARSAITNALWIGGGQSGVGWFHPVGWVLLLINTVGQGLYALMMSIGSGLLGALASQTRREPLWQVARRYGDFAAYRAPQIVINVASQGLPIMLLAALFSTKAAGFYALGRTVMGAPSMLLGKAVGDVFYPRIANAAHIQEPLLPLVRKATVALAITGFAPFLVVMLAGPWLFGLVFGVEWERAGEYARWISVWMLFAFINAPSVTVLPVLRMQRFHLFVTCFTLAVRVVVLAGAYLWSGDDLVAVAYFGVTGAVINIFLIGLYMNKCHVYDEDRRNN
ncbi:lipopolysaccharide biosynthesis protein [Stutzerimonas nitrititolerans]|uniref:lipopolysaccharide biosynthesis protein n=1 Tax=Stutzerimonas nitrititolerans TaxID=2482751 RepID=UPI0028ABE8C0|nr:oligosaccharide flippase family protein [Stutzerimonas nitrititolerans]